MHLLPNISQSKGNQTLKFAQLIKYNKEVFFFKIYTEIKTVRLVPDLFLLFKKTSYEVKTIDLQLGFNIFG